MTPADILLTDQVAVITAGANGLGEGMATTMARFGAHVAIIDIDAENGERVAKGIRALNRQALFIRADATDTSQLTAAIEHAHSHFGRVDILANNAGGTRRRPFVDQSERSWRRHIDLNFVSMLAATQVTAKLMIAGQRGGTILNVASSEALRGAPGFAVYAGCKAAMVSFSRTMALELAEHRIRVHALAPDMIETPGLKPYFEAATPAEVAARDRYIPLGRLGTMDEFGAVAVFLCSQMASYLTGLTLPVDAGALASSGWTRSPETGEWNLYHGAR